MRLPRRRDKTQRARARGQRQCVARVHTADPARQPVELQPDVHVRKIERHGPAAHHLHQAQRAQHGRRTTGQARSPIRPARTGPQRADHQRGEACAQQHEVQPRCKDDHQVVAADLHAARPMQQPADHDGQPNQRENSADAASYGDKQAARNHAVDLSVGPEVEQVRTNVPQPGNRRKRALLERLQGQIAPPPTTWGSRAAEMRCVLHPM